MEQTCDLVSMAFMHAPASHRKGVHWRHRDAKQREAAQTKLTGRCIEEAEVPVLRACTRRQQTRVRRVLSEHTHAQKVWLGSIPKQRP